MLFGSINESAQMYIKNPFKNTKVKIHAYIAHRVNESLLITVYSITPMMVVIGDGIFIQIELNQ